MSAKPVFLIMLVNKCRFNTDALHYQPIAHSCILYI